MCNFTAQKMELNKNIHRGVEKKEWYDTIFGEDFQTIVYWKDMGQHKGHISILAHPDDVPRINEILYRK